MGRKMTDPRNIREVNIQNEGFRKSLEDRVGVFQKMVWTVIGLLGALLIAAFTIYFQIGDVKTDVAVVKTNITNLLERFSKVEKNVEDSRSAERQMVIALGRIEARQQPVSRDPVVAGFYLTEGESSLVRQFIKTLPKNDNKPTISVGSQVPDDKLQPIPGDLEAKVPRLKGVRYVIDANNAIALTVPGTGFVFAVV